MTLEQKRQEIRKKINEACPELLKLEFGCEVKDLKNNVVGTLTVVSENKNMDTIYHIVTYSDKVSPYAFNSPIHKAIFPRANLNAEFSDYIEILGKPPTLEHILRTMYKNEKWKGDEYYTFGETFCITSSGKIMKFDDNSEKDYDGISMEYKAHYDLTNSPLEQSEEVTNFIYQLICEQYGTQQRQD